MVSKVVKHRSVVYDFGDIEPPVSTVGRYFPPL